MTTESMESLCAVNPETLDAATPPHFTFRYIDISAVTEGRIDWSATQIQRFSEAPTRARRRLRDGDALLCTVRPSLKAHARPQRPDPPPLVASTGFAVLRPYVRSDSSFVYHQLFSDSISAQLRARETGSNYPAVSEGDVKRLNLYAPTPAERHHIGAVLDALDEAISKTDAVIAKLKQIRAGLLHDLLTRGLDENGQLRDPIARPEQFTSSPLGRIPTAWQVKPLGTHSDLVTSGSRGWASYHSETGALFLRITNLTRDSIDLRLDDIVRVNPPPGAEGARTKVQPGDLLISITADLGITGVAPGGIGDAYVNQHIALVRVRAEACPRWIARYLASGSGAVAFQRLNDSGAKAGLNLKAVDSLPVAMPPHEEQLLATQILDSIDTQIRKNQSALAKRHYLKKGVAADLLSGRVRVPESLITPQRASGV
jgi:type I restriction enzyme, S subunit